MSRSAQDPAGASVGPEPVILEVSGLAKSYRAPGGALVVLEGLDLRVRRGTILAIVGVSGVGKSTLLNILGTLDRPDRGTVTIRGERVDHLPEPELARFRARRLGFVFQFHHLLPEFTAEENVMMPLLVAGQDPGTARARARRVLADVGLTSRWEHRPAELSGGEAQRVAVARALAPEPDLVLADEPSGDLDPAGADGLHALIATLAREHRQTFVIVTHNDRLARVAHRVTRLEHGRLTAVSGEE